MSNLQACEEVALSEIRPFVFCLKIHAITDGVCSVPELLMVVCLKEFICASVFIFSFFQTKAVTEAASFSVDLSPGSVINHLISYTAPVAAQRPV